MSKVLDPKKNFSYRTGESAADHKNQNNLQLIKKTMSEMKMNLHDGPLEEWSWFEPGMVIREEDMHLHERFTVEGEQPIETEIGIKTEWLNVDEIVDQVPVAPTL